MRHVAICFLTAACALAQTHRAPAHTTHTTTHRAPAAAHKPPMLHPAAYKAKAPATYKAKFTTTKGDFVVEITRTWAPLGADRFYNLVKGGFFDGAPIFRVIPNFVAQFGLSPNAAVNRAWEHANIKDDPVLQSNKKGTLTFATAGPNTRTTQIFINLNDNAGLDSQGFAPFGTVVEGMDVVQKFYSGYGGDLDQEKLASGGRAYFEKQYPQMDVIKTAVLIGAPAPAPTHRTAPAHRAPAATHKPAAK